MSSTHKDTRSGTALVKRYRNCIIYYLIQFNCTVIERVQSYHWRLTVLQGYINLDTKN